MINWIKCFKKGNVLFVPSLVFYALQTLSVAANLLPALLVEYLTVYQFY